MLPLGNVLFWKEQCSAGRQPGMLGVTALVVASPGFAQLMMFQYKHQSLGTECECTGKHRWLLGKGRDEIPG